MSRCWRIAMPITGSKASHKHQIRNVVLAADAVEGMQAVLRCGTRAVAGLIGEGNAVIGLHGLRR